MGEREAALNRQYWSTVNAQFTDQEADRCWQAPDISWGIFHTPEADLDVLGDVRGLDVVELGCGTAYFSAWLARRGARPVGVDVTPAQLATARRCQQKYELTFPLIEASGEAVPLPDQSCDLVLSEYGASLWCEPARWIAEAGRLLRPQGRLVFMTGSLLLAMCLPEGDGQALPTLQRSQRDSRRIAWPSGGVEYHLAHGEWISLLRAHGFEIELLLELHAPATADQHTYYGHVSVDWATRWPVEELWVARKR